MSNAIVLFSGGMDSTICLFDALEKYNNVKALSIFYGQKHKREIECAEKICSRFNINYEILILPTSILKGGELLSNTFSSGVSSGIAPTWVPERNMLFITIAFNRAIVENYDTIVTGVSQIDYSGYPDCRETTLITLQIALNFGAESDIKLKTPLMYISKADSLLMAKQIPDCWAALHYSHTCYNNQYPPCGECAACILREQAFKEAKMLDPLFENDL